MPTLCDLQMNPLSYQIAKRFSPSHVGLVNLVAGKELIKEFIPDFTTADVSDELICIARRRASAEVPRGMKDLHRLVGGSLASRAADRILEFFDNRNK